MPVRSQLVMGTLVTIHVVADSPNSDEAIERAFGWFNEIETRCTRFDESSELMRLTAQAGNPTPASPVLYEAVRFALQLAEETDGAFDPTVGHRMAARGFNREHRTGRVAPALSAGNDVSYKDVRLDPDQKTITLLRPLTLDLGAVAKGLAIDLAVRELAPVRDFAIDAGGDLYLGGSNPEGLPWRVGIRHPRSEEEVIDSLLVSNQAVCTSGDYERRLPIENQNRASGHHILNPRTGVPSRGVASVTVVAPGAMLADALATAAFVLGPEAGIQLLDRMGVSGLMITPELDLYETGALRHAA